MEYVPHAKRQRKEPLKFEVNAPSCVVHARNVSDRITEEEIAGALDKYGTINEIVLMPQKRQALIEFEDIDSAMACVNEAIEKNLFISGTQCYLNYSTSQKIIRKALTGYVNNTYEDRPEQPTAADEKRVLMINVLQPLYPITVSVIHKICHDYGKVLRILIFRKNGVQVMVEYGTGDAAAKAKENLDGADIYSGCCTLSIDFAKTNRIVMSNDADGCDFTLTESDHPTTQDYQQRTDKSKSNNLTSLMSLTESNFEPTPSSHQSNNSLGQTIVLSAHNLCPDHFNCDKLFNLVSLYGNVDKIKFLLSKEGSAMLQMSNAKALHDAIPTINNTLMFGRKIQLHVGKQTVLQPVVKPINLKDGTTSYKEYLGNRNNRYQTAEAAQKNKPLPPSCVLYWYNAPPGITEEQIFKVFQEAGAMVPTRWKIFPKKIDKSSTGLIEWENVSDATEALILANHTEIHHSSSKFPYIFKMCFSGTPMSKNRNYENRNFENEHDYNDEDDQE